MAAYLLAEGLRPDDGVRARYYAGEFVPQTLTLIDQIAQQIIDGDLAFSDAVDMLMREEVQQGTEDLDAAEDRIADQLTEATERLDKLAEIADRGGTVAEVRQDIHPHMARALGVNPARPLTEGEVANLLDGRTANGEAIPGKQVQKPMRSVADIFGFDGTRMPSAAEVESVIVGLRVDGGPMRLSAETIAGARSRFLAAYGMLPRQEPTKEQVERIKAGQSVHGLQPKTSEVLRKLNATKPPIAYVDMVWSPHKSISVAWALAPTEAERAAVLYAHKAAAADAMGYVEERLGVTRKGRAGRDGIEPGHVAWMNFSHYTSRPTEGADADPQLHTHAILLNAVQTASGRIGSLDLDRLDGLVKEFGSVYQAYLARNLRQHGIDVVLDQKTGAARIAALPDDVSRLFSKRSKAAEDYAQSIATDSGLSWESLTQEHQIALLDKAVQETRLAKDKTDGKNDFQAWREQAEEHGYRHGSVLRPDEIKTEFGPSERRQVAYEASLPFIEDALSRRAKLGGQDLREFAARGLIVAGIDRPGEDIAAVTKAYRELGVRQDGQMVPILWGKDAPIRGKERWSVTTDMHVEGEQELITAASKLGADRTAALTPAAIERAVLRFLEKRPDIDRTSEQWRKQREIIEKLGTGPKLAVAIGAAGAGKSTLLTPIVDALRGSGREVYGLAVAWRQASAFTESGLNDKHRAAADAFIRRVTKGTITPSHTTTVIVDEIGQMGRRQMVDLLRLQQRHGFQLLALGDDKQCQSIEAGPTIDLLRKALGPEAVPEILTSIRQRTEREREIAGLFREGRAAEALAMKREDGTVILAPGGREAAIRRVAELWRERIEARKDEPDFSLTVSAPTNAEANSIGKAIRAELRELGRLGLDEMILKTAVRGERADLPLAVGDRVRVFDMVRVDQKEFASNGQVVEVLALSESGMRARNAAGRVADVPWAKLRDQGQPVRLTYGYALTIDAMQGSTSDEHIDALVSGTKSVQGFKAYTAESRHRDKVWMVLSDGAERREIGAKIPHGVHTRITENDVWQNVARNLARQPVKASALEFMRVARDLQHGSLASFQRGMVPIEIRERAGRGWADVRQAVALKAAQRAMAMTEAVVAATQKARAALKL